MSRCLLLCCLCIHGAAFAETTARHKAAASAQLAAREARPVTPSPLVKVADGRLLAPDIARILNRGELVIALLHMDNPPFFSDINGVLSGTDVDLGQLIAKELGIPVRFDRSAVTYDGVVAMVANGEADIGIGRLARTLKRAQSVHFSSSYMRLGHALLINRMRFAEIAGDKPIAQVVRSFSGKIGVISNSAWEEFGRRNFPLATIVAYPTWNDAVTAVKKGEVVATYRDELEVLAIVRSDPSLALTLRTVTFNDIESSLSLMVGVLDATLLSFVNEVIAQRPEKPTVSSVLKSIK
jgi:polar amino acid transport system substrate-binding protein